MTREQAAEFLRGYKQSNKQKEYLENLLSELESKKGMEEYCAKIRQKISEECDKIKNIISALNKVTYADGRNVLMYRYIMGCSTRETADKTFISERHVQRITNKALDELAERLEQE